MNIKIQLKGRVSTNALIESGIDKINSNDYLTFHAFSDTMKARMLESLLKSTPGTIAISICDDAPKTGEWMEPLAKIARHCWVSE